MQIGAARRSRQLDELATALPQRASALTRIFFARTATGLSRAEVGLLAALSSGPHRITELAAREGISQPGVTAAIAGSRSGEHMRQNADAGDLALDAGTIAEVEALLAG